MTALEGVSSVVKAPDGATLWVWETNISPFWARTGLGDLREELAIFAGVGQVPAGAYRWIRTGEDQGARGELLEHPLFQEEAFLSVNSAVAEDLSGDAGLDEDSQGGGVAKLEQCVSGLQGQLRNALSVAGRLYSALEDASKVVDKDDDEAYAYQAELEAGAKLLGMSREPAG